MCYDTEMGMRDGGEPSYYHVECFAQLRTELGWLESASLFAGFNMLSIEEQTTVQMHIP